MTRLETWPAALAAALERAAAMAFDWGTFDCALHAADCVLAETGRDYAAWFRGRYRTEIGALRALKRFAGGGLLETADKLMTPSARIDVPCAGRGDLVLLDVAEARPALGIVDLSGLRAAFATRKGLAYLPLLEPSAIDIGGTGTRHLARIAQAWRV